MIMSWKKSEVKPKNLETISIFDHNELIMRRQHECALRPITDVTKPATDIWSRNYRIIKIYISTSAETTRKFLSSRLLHATACLNSFLLSPNISFSGCQNNAISIQNTKRSKVHSVSAPFARPSISER